MSRKVDPVRKAIDAFVALNDEERRAFKAALAMHAALSAEVPAMEKRGPGRPRGSKNHSDATPVPAAEVMRNIERLKLSAPVLAAEVK